MLAAVVSTFWLRGVFAVIATGACFPVHAANVAHAAQRPATALPGVDLSRQQAQEPSRHADEEPGDDWLEARFEIVGRIRAALAAGDRAAARTLLEEWTVGGVEALVAEVEQPRVDSLLVHLDELALAAEHPRLCIAARRAQLARLLANPGSSTTARANMHANLARAQRWSGDGAAARSQFEAAVALLASDPNAPADTLHEGRVELASQLQRMQEYAAEAAVRTAIVEELARRLAPDDVELTMQRYLAACALCDAGDTTSGLPMMRAAHEALAAKLPADAPQLLEVRRSLGLVLSGAEFDEEALPLLEFVAAADRADRPIGDWSRVQVEHALMLSYRTRGDFHRAAAVFADAVAGLELLLPPDSWDLARNRDRLADLYHDCGAPGRARALYESALAAVANVPDPDQDVVDALREGIATTRFVLGDTDGARVLFEQLLATRAAAVEAGDPDALRLTLNYTATLWRSSDMPRALEILDGIREACERCAVLDPSLPIRLHANRGCMLCSLGRHEEALAAFEAEHRLLVASGSASREGLVHNDLNRASALIELDRAGEALALLAPRVAATASSEHAAAWLQVRVHGAALQCAVLVGDVERQHAIADELVEILRAEALAHVHESPRDASAWAVSTWPHVMRLVASSSAPSSEGDERAAPTHRRVLELMLAVRSAVESSNVAGQATAGSTELVALVEEWREVRRQLAAHAARAPADAAGLATWSARTDELVTARRALERRMRVGLADRGAAVETPSVDELAARLGPNAALVVFSEGGMEPGRDVRSYAFVVTSGSVVERLDLGPSGAILASIEQWRAALGRPVDRGLATADTTEDAEQLALAELRRLLVAPLLVALDGRTIERLHLVPDGFLHLVPFDALCLDDGRLVGEAFEVRVEASITRFGRADVADSTAGTLVTFGGIDFGAKLEAPSTEGAGGDRARTTSFQPLLQSRFECEAVAELYALATDDEPVVATRAAATKAALTAAAPSARYLHLATHGWFSTSAPAAIEGLGLSSAVLDQMARNAVSRLPETLCGLALAGANSGPEGILTAEELATLDLSNCELAVLSACETNVGIRQGGQGIQSLQTALHVAGARTAITSLWKVDDAATRRLFELFYTKLWSENLGPADALWQAKMALRSEGHPTRDWAGWVLTGGAD
jgi:CHAT domain-containing protein/tetratricopeptide (TPR) repeat protein